MVSYGITEASVDLVLVERGEIGSSLELVVLRRQEGISNEHLQDGQVDVSLFGVEFTYWTEQSKWSHFPQQPNVSNGIPPFLCFTSSKQITQQSSADNFEDESIESSCTFANSIFKKIGRLLINVNFLSVFNNRKYTQSGIVYQRTNNFMTPKTFWEWSFLRFCRVYPNQQIRSFERTDSRFALCAARSVLGSAYCSLIEAEPFMF